MRTPDPRPIPKIVGDGHFSSPIVDPSELKRRKEELWPANPPLRGVDYREPEQAALFDELVPFMKDFPFPERRQESGGFFMLNEQFGGLDALMFFGLLRKFKPMRLLEIGAGYSTMLAVETRAEFLNDRPLIVCVEPFPTPERARVLSGKVTFLLQPVWAVNPAAAEQLEAGDIFFVDGSHVSKTGSDTHTVFFDLFPRLKPGVYIHVHDIFLPFEYPYDWVVEDGRHWNEQYLLLAILANSKRYEVVFSSAYFGTYHRDVVRGAFGSELTGGSIWLRVT